MTCRTSRAVAMGAAVTLAATACLGAINPASPGLAPAKAYGQESIRNNGASALCVECHTENPVPGTGTHFVLNAVGGALRRTHSGGGWEKSSWGVREKGEFFKITPWLEAEFGSGGSSKYGDAETWESVVYVGSEGTLGAENARKETTLAKMATLEIVCESCHSLRANVAGRYRLLCKVTSSATEDDLVEGATAVLCVGCHGFLYQDDAGAANSLNANWNDPRNLNPITGGRRGNNEVHYINGKPYVRNHHVGTGDAIDTPLAAAGLLMRDVEVIDARSISMPINRASRKGTYPVKATPLAPILAPQDPAFLHCVTCHAPGHRGDRTLGAALLRGVGLNGKDRGVGIDRIVDGLEWGRFSDGRFCGSCHE